jgi:hypothetical protein
VNNVDECVVCPSFGSLYSDIKKKKKKKKKEKKKEITQCTSFISS